MAEAATLSVLVVDDERGIRELVKRCLFDPRFRLAEASSGEEALALVGDPKSLDLLITDEMMPGMEGHELSRRLRAANPNLKVLYLTGHSDRLFEAKDIDGVRFARLSINTGTPSDLPRPSITPEDVRRRLQTHIGR